MNPTHSKSLTVAAVSALVLCLVPMSNAQSSQSQSGSSTDQSNRSSSGWNSGNNSTSSSSMSNDQSNQSNQDWKNARHEMASMMGHRESAHKLMGRAVNSSSGEKLGDIHDFVIDSQSGRIAYAVVSSGGVLGIGDTLRLVPVSALKPDMSSRTAGASGSAGSVSVSTAAKESFTLNVDKAKWDAAPKFKSDQLADISSQRSQLDQYYGVNSDSGRMSSGSSMNASDRSGSNGAQLVMARDIIGKNIKTNDNKDVGNIDDLVVDLRARKASILLDADKDFIGNNNNAQVSTSSGSSTMSASSNDRNTGKYVVSFDKVTISGKDKVTTSLTPDQFAGVSVSAGSTSVSFPGSSGVYAFTGWSDDSDRSGSMAATGIGGSAGSTTTDTGGATISSGRAGNTGDRSVVMSRSANDMDNLGQASVEAVRQALNNDRSLPAAARQVQVSEQNGKIVLRGTVPNRDLKNTIEDKVEEAAHGWDIDNQISVTAEKD